MAVQKYSSSRVGTVRSSASQWMTTLTHMRYWNAPWLMSARSCPWRPLISLLPSKKCRDSPPRCLSYRLKYSARHRHWFMNISQKWWLQRVCISNSSETCLKQAFHSILNTTCTRLGASVTYSLTEIRFIKLILRPIVHFKRKKRNFLDWKTQPNGVDFHQMFNKSSSSQNFLPIRKPRSILCYHRKQPTSKRRKWNSVSTLTSVGMRFVVSQTIMEGYFSNISRTWLSYTARKSNR